MYIKLVNLYACPGNVSNVTKKKYNVLGTDSTMDCATQSIVCLISCKKCGVQYVGKTSQKLHSQFSNHRSRLRSMGNLYLYNHFSSDGHDEEDICICLYIEKTNDTDSRSGSTSKMLEREDYWYKKLCTIPMD